MYLPSTFGLNLLNVSVYRVIYKKLICTYVHMKELHENMVKVMDTNQFTPLHYACRNSTLEEVTLLIKDVKHLNIHIILGLSLSTIILLYIWLCSPM
jgi:ankyrin repeat protein